MANIQVIKSGTWHDFLERKGCWLEGEHVLWIVPEEDKRRLEKAGIGPISTIPELIKGFVRREKRGQFINIHGAESILSAIIGESPVRYLKMEKYRQGYVKALTDFIYNFRSFSTLDLQSAIKSFTGSVLTNKERDLIELYTEYDRRLPEYDYDLQSGLFSLKEGREGDLLSALGLHPKASMVFFGFNYITHLEEEFILLACNNGVRVNILTCAESFAAEQSLRIQGSINNLLKRLGGTEKEIRPACSGDYFSSLACEIFQDEPVPLREKLIESGAENIFIERKNDRFYEVISMARQIRKLKKEGVPLEDIRILAPNYPLYSSIIQDVFPQYNIPFSLERGVPLTKYPLAVLFANILNQSQHSNPFPLRKKIFSSPYVTFSLRVTHEDLCEYQKNRKVEILTPENIKSHMPSGSVHVLDYDYVRDTQDEAYSYVQPAGSINQLELAGKYLNSLKWNDEKGKNHELVKCLIQFYLLSRAEKALSPWRLKMTGPEFGEAFLKMSQKFHIRENISFSHGGGGEKTSLEERDLVIWQRIQELLEELKGIVRGEVSIAEHIRVFSRLLDEGYLELQGDDGGVEIQPATKGQYRKWDYTFICGMVDGEFPEEESFNFLHPKKEGMRLGHAYTSVDHGRNTFYHLVRSTGKALFLSQPLSHNGKLLPVSPFLKEVERLYPEEYFPRKETESHELYSKRDELIFIGENVDYDYDLVRPRLRKIKEENEYYCYHLKEILRFHGLTANPTFLSEYEGMFSPDSPLLHLLEGAIQGIAFSPDMLECYSSCPMRFFLHHILEMGEDPDYHPDNTDNGRFILSLLNHYTEKACCTEGIPPEAEVMFKEMILEYFTEMYGEGEDAFQLRLRNELLRGLDDSQGKRPGLFKAFLDYEKKAPDLLKPYAAGISGSVEINPELKVSISIDRVDITSAGDYLLMFLYTTGLPPHPRQVKKGLALELPLALSLLTEYTEKEGIPVPIAGGGYYMVKGSRDIKRRDYLGIESIKASRQNSVSSEKPVFSGQRDGFVGSHELPMVLEKIKHHVDRLHGLMKKGVFHLPLCGVRDFTCSNCSFSRICRKDELLLESLRLNLWEDAKLNVVKEIY